MGLTDDSMVRLTPRLRSPQPASPPRAVNITTSVSRTQLTMALSGDESQVACRQACSASLQLQSMQLRGDAHYSHMSSHMAIVFFIISLSSLIS